MLPSSRTVAPPVIASAAAPDDTATSESRSTTTPAPVTTTWPKSSPAAVRSFHAPVPSKVSVNPLGSKSPSVFTVSPAPANTPPSPATRSAEPTPPMPSPTVNAPPASRAKVERVKAPLTTWRAWVARSLPAVTVIPAPLIATWPKSSPAAV